MNKLHVYTGNGKGKTTAAMGLALRSLGHGNPVLVAQFMKRANSGELAALRKLDACVLTAPPITGFTFRMDAETQVKTAAEQSALIPEILRKIAEIAPKTVILDELGIALTTGMVAREDAEALLDAALRSGETAVTGRNVPDWLLDRADYVSRIQADKHPYATEKLPARKGVEW